MNRSGILLDTGPLVAFLSKHDNQHVTATALFAECEPPFRTCEAVIAEACFLLRGLADGPAQVVALGRKRVYEISIALTEHQVEVEALLRKYRNQPASLADACLIRCAELHEEPRILTFDSDFGVYRWAARKRFHIL